MLFGCKKQIRLLSEITNDELIMLDTLPNITEKSRLSCQLHLNNSLNNIVLRILGDGVV